MNANGTSRWIVASALLLGGAVALAEGTGGPPTPPPEAFQACQSFTEGASCTVNFHGQDVTGTCRTGPQGTGPLACVPPRPPGR